MLTRVKKFHYLCRGDVTSCQNTEISENILIRKIN